MSLLDAGAYDEMDACIMFVTSYLQSWCTRHAQVVL